MSTSINQRPTLPARDGAATSFVSLNGALQGQDATAWVKSGIRFEF